MDISKFHRTQTHVQMHAQKHALLHVLPCLSTAGVHVPQTALAHPLHSRDRELDEIGVKPLLVRQGRGVDPGSDPLSVELSAAVGQARDWQP